MALLVTAALCAGPAAVAQSAPSPPEAAVILASDAPGLTSGGVLDLRGRITLERGESATLLMRSGEILRLNGPFVGALADASEPLRSGVSLYAEILRLRGVDASSVGGTRALGALAKPPATTPDPFAELVLPAGEHATYCVFPGMALWVTRPAHGDGHFELRRAGMFRTILFPGGASRAPWPDDVAVEDADRFDLLQDGVPVASYVFHVRTAYPGSVAATVAAGMLDGCQGQVAPLFAEMARMAATGSSPAD